MELEFKIIRHKDIDSDTIHEICKLKDESWPYGLSNQKQWISANISANDYHVLMYLGGMVGYVNLVHREIIINNEDETKFLGIGNVCIGNAFKKKGLGLKMMEFIVNFIKENQFRGILFCKVDLVTFYERSGWILIKGFLINDNEDVRTMVYNMNGQIIKKIQLNGLLF